MSIPLDLSGTAAVITGGGSGIGRGTALAFARRGAKIVVGDLREDRANEVAAEVVAAGGEAIGVGCDVSSEADIEALREAALSAYGRLDVIMNNVGILAMGAPESLPDEAWARSVDINIMSIARSNRVFLPALIEQGHGHVVNTASANGLLAYGFDRLPYVATKHAVVGLTEALALYLAPKGVGVTLLCPSGVKTNVMEGVVGYGTTSSRPVAPKHALSEPEDVGERVGAAVSQGRFLVTTAPEIIGELAERGTDLDGYLQARIAELT